MLVLIDTSGSMNTPVPGSTKTRLELTISAAQQGLGIVGDDTELGLWIFSSRLEGENQDYRELVPVGPLSEPVGDALRRAALANALTRLKAKGNTGLYDSILAAYRSQLATYARDKVGSVLVFTDGKNRDPDGGISLDQLLSTLQRESDPERPMPIFILAFGPDADMASATRIAEATAGAAYHADTPGQAYELYLDALGQRQCRPNC
jgi:Mg-chelatase subunit ChlD